MSDYESHSGNIRQIPRLENESLDNVRRRIWAERNPDKEFNNDDFDDQFHDEIFRIGTELYEIYDHEEHEHGNAIVQMHPNGDGSFKFYTHFYNGGTYLGEMLAEGIKNQLK